jgi:hypothetical protein
MSWPAIRRTGPLRNRRGMPETNQRLSHTRIKVEQLFVPTLSRENFTVLRAHLRLRAFKADF